MVFLFLKLILPEITELNFAFHVFIAGSSWSSCHENIFFKLVRNIITDRPTSGHRASGSYGYTGLQGAAQLHSSQLRTWKWSERGRIAILSCIQYIW